MICARYLLPAVTAMLAACTSGAPANTLSAQAEKPDPRRGEEVRNLCFARSIDSFGETTRNSVVVREGMDYYLIETFSGCFDLDRAQSLRFDNATSCLSKGDRIIAYDSAFGPDRIGPSSVPCSIKAIYEWNPDTTEDADSEDTDNTAENNETPAN